MSRLWVSSEVGRSYYMFLDGVKSPAYRSIDMGKIAFVAEKLVYVAKTNDGKWHVVVNDKPGPAYDGVLTLLVNDDNSHYAFIAAAGGSRKPPGCSGGWRPRHAASRHHPEYDHRVERPRCLRSGRGRHARVAQRLQRLVRRRP